MYTFRQEQNKQKFFFVRDSVFCGVAFDIIKCKSCGDFEEVADIFLRRYSTLIRKTGSP